ncbi:DUF5686 family protein [Winogradskyella maritima]|uniref:DUF5686 family protein n=1 Tax=Winogradskyella maritima TaxID=1517766 RepID=A0ABV8AIN9_9FLAO|nr:DUF5686 family protein [Winogradskyella maritima]
MIKHLVIVLLLLTAVTGRAQTPKRALDSITKVERDSIRKAEFLQNIGVGYFPTKYWNFDLRHLVKFNQFEGFRTGVGGITNEAFSEKYRVNGYVVYGFKDKEVKYSIGGGVRLHEGSGTWLNATYTDDLQETGSSGFLTDKRFFTFFEPRLLNIDLFHRKITKSLSLEHRISNHLLSETEVAVSRINPTYNYNFDLNGELFNTFALSTATVSLQWSPFSQFEMVDKRVDEVVDGFPKFTLQYTKGFADVFNADFNFGKVDFRTIHQFSLGEDSITNLTLVGGLAGGEIPLTHLYHAYPNNINKDTILQRFSVAGLNSFETMYFNEFFSDRFMTFQFKHFLRPFNISDWFKPQLVLISRHALGNMRSRDRHIGIPFETLEQLYSESGFEINKLIFGFGLSFAYRYGSYHLPVFEDNFAFKFTFNLSL